jgi:hypothetical protein
LIESLFENVDATTGNDSDMKLTPKSKVINIDIRRESAVLSRIYKKLTHLGFIELRGNKGYFALVDLDVALQGVQNAN